MAGRRAAAEAHSATTGLKLLWYDVAARMGSDRGVGLTKTWDSGIFPCQDGTLFDSAACHSV